MKEYLKKMIPVAPSEKFAFRCTMCGACCRHVRESVLLESLDLFRLAKYLRSRDQAIRCTDDALAIYAEPVLLHRSGYAVFMLKTTGPEDSCIFLEGNRCTVHAAKPRACRTYPLAIGPDGHGSIEQYLSREQTHHFKGPQTTVKRWSRQRFTKEDRAFCGMEIGSAREIALLLKDIPEHQKARAIVRFLYYKYSAFDLDMPFLPQFEHNTKVLLEELRAMSRTAAMKEEQNG